MTENHGRDRANNFILNKYPWVKPVLIIAVLVIGGIGGVWTGNWLASRRPDPRQIQRDEYVGLGTRTGLVGDLSLSVHPVSVTIRSGEPIRVRLTLTNNGEKTILLNSWFTPAPAEFGNNQLPFKVKVTRNGAPVPYIGDAVLFPPHTKKDFLKLRPGEKRVVSVDLSRGPHGGRWDLSAPGNYTFEVWYETYLTGRYIGVKAWTGMTNHVIVNVVVLSQ
jgi:hypothetical protein